MNSRLAVLGLLLAGCSTEAARVRDARDHFYQAISAFDQAAVRAAVAPDYVSVDHGRLFNVDSLIADMILLEQESLSVRYAFADSAVRVDPPLAWAVFLSRKILTRPNFTDTTFSVESATFRREGSGWRLVLLHRTPLDRAVTHFEATAPTSPPPPAASPESAAGARRTKLRDR